MFCVWLETKAYWEWQSKYIIINNYSGPACRPSTTSGTNLKTSRRLSRNSKYNYLPTKRTPRPKRSPRWKTICMRFKKQTPKTSRPASFEKAPKLQYCQPVHSAAGMPAKKHRCTLYPTWPTWLGARTGTAPTWKRTKSQPRASSYRSLVYSRLFGPRTKSPRTSMYSRSTTTRNLTKPPTRVSY